MEILKSLRFLATAKPFVDEQLYDYKPKKKVYRGRQYNSGNVVTRSRNNDRANNFPEPIVENIPDESEETSLNAEENPDAIQTKTVQSSLEVVNEAKKKIENVVKATIEKTSKITQSVTRETAADSIAAIREEAAKVTESVKSEVNKIAQATGSGTSQTAGPAPVDQKPGPTLVDQKPEPEQIPEPSAETDKEVAAPKIASDVVSTTDEVFIEADVGTTEDSQIDLNVELST